MGSGPVITLLTDFGVSEPYVGVLQGVILSQAAGRPTIVSLTHDVPPQDVGLAALFLEYSWSNFPAGTVHVAVVDPGVGTEREILLVEHAGHRFLAPDNGLLSFLFEAGATALVLEPVRVRSGEPSATFHGRDLFAPAAARLVSGARPEELARSGSAASIVPVRLEPTEASVRPDGALEAEVLFFDHFGNAVTSARADQLSGGVRGWTCELSVDGHGSRELHGVRTYGEGSSVQAGVEAVFLVNSFGRIELSVPDGSAKDELGLSRGERVLFRQSG